MTIGSKITNIVVAATLGAGIVASAAPAEARFRGGGFHRGLMARPMMRPAFHGGFVHRPFVRTGFVHRPFVHRAAFAHPGLVHRPFFHRTAFARPVFVRRPFFRHRFPAGAFAAGLIGGAALGTLAAPVYATPWSRTSARIASWCAAGS